MKTALHIMNGHLVKWLPLGLAAVLTCGCNSVYMNFDYDDVYGHAPSRSQERQMLAKASYAPNGTQAAENTYYYDEATGEYYLYEDDTATYEYPEFDYDQYYDYEYSSRLRRFHQDDYITDNYYDDYYTNTYWYDQNPYSYGTSIYLGYNNWSPSFTVYGGGWSLGLSYGYDPFWYRPYRYWPYYSYWDWGWPGYWGPGWGSNYWNGYWDGYHDGFWGHHWACNDYFYNSFDKNTYYKQEIRRGYSNAGSGSGGSQPLAVRRGGDVAGNTGNTGGSVTSAGNNSVRRGTAVGASGGAVTGGGSSSNLRRTSSFAERYQAAVSQEQRVSVNKDANIRDNGGVSTSPVRPTQRQSNAQSVRTPATSGTVRLNESIGKENNTTAPQRTVSPTTPQRTVTPQRTTTTTQKTVSPATPQRTRPNAYTAPSYNSGSRNGASYYSPQYQRQTSTNSYYRSNQNNTGNPQTITAPARQSVPVYQQPATPVRQTATTTVRTTTPSRSTSSTSSGSSSGNSGSSNTRRR